MRVLTGRTALIHGGGGAVGGAVARAFAAAGARVHLAGRSRARLGGGGGRLRRRRRRGGGRCARRARRRRARRRGGGGRGRDRHRPERRVLPVRARQAFAEVSVEDVLHPIDRHLRANLVTAKAVAPHMAARGAGTILTLSAAASRVVAPGSLGYGTACAAIETLTQRLAVELGPSGVRVACLRSHLIADGPAHGSSTAALFARRATAAGVGVEQLLAQLPANVTLLGRLPTLAQVADAAVFVASDGGAAITGAVLDLTCGSAVRTAAGPVVGVLD